MGELCMQSSHLHQQRRDKKRQHGAICSWQRLEEDCAVGSASLSQSLQKNANSYLSHASCAHKIIRRNGPQNIIQSPLRGPKVPWSPWAWCEAICWDFPRASSQAPHKFLCAHTLFLFTLSCFWLHSLEACIRELCPNLLGIHES